MRVQLGIRQAGIEIGHWDNLVRRRYREVSTLKTENLTPAKRFPQEPGLIHSFSSSLDGLLSVAFAPT